MNLYIGCNGYVSAIQVETGAELWRTQLKEGFMGSSRGSDVCVLEHEGRVLAGCNGHLFCLSTGTGHILWENELKGMGYNDVTLAIAGKSIQYVASHTHSSSNT